MREREREEKHWFFFFLMMDEEEKKIEPLPKKPKKGELFCFALSAKQSPQLLPTSRRRSPLQEPVEYGEDERPAEQEEPHFGFERKRESFLSSCSRSGVDFFK